MRFSFFRTWRFERCIKHLKKRYPHIANDLVKGFENIERDPEIGSVIPDDFAIRKLRLSSSDMQRGKSGGFRLLYKLRKPTDEDIEVVLLFLYAKSNQADITAAFLETLDDNITD